MAYNIATDDDYFVFGLDGESPHLALAGHTKIDEFDSMRAARKALRKAQNIFRDPLKIVPVE